ncbi:rhodanese-like domain-containing protein [Arthrobacter sp. TB 23]|uniref:rhodanese-like domain-containing protein n=1 Tax=Arthrobacter sp. TB 23 TaxID=494419 RepID=UPI000A048492|nr:rhodanese-like domain-containing protein [Arthrobacter sp. TB 23]
MSGNHPHPTISADELATVWPRVTLVDVRSREEHATAHIPGSLNIPLEELPSRLANLPGSTIHVLCGSGKRSSHAARILRGHGYQAVNVAGGITEWYRSGYPVTYQQPPENPARQAPRHVQADRRSFARRLFHRRTA